MSTKRDVSAATLGSTLHNQSVCNHEAALRRHLDVAIAAKSPIKITLQCMDVLRRPLYIMEHYHCTAAGDVLARLPHGITKSTTAANIVLISNRRMQPSVPASLG